MFYRYSNVFESLFHLIFTFIIQIDRIFPFLWKTKALKIILREKKKRITDVTSVFGWKEMEKIERPKKKIWDIFVWKRCDVVSPWLFLEGSASLPLRYLTLPYSLPLMYFYSSSNSPYSHCKAAIFIPRPVRFEGGRGGGVPRIITPIGFPFWHILHTFALITKKKS